MAAGGALFYATALCGYPGAWWVTGKSAFREGLHDRHERAERKAHGAQRPRHHHEFGEGASTAQRSDLLAPQVMQTFPKQHTQGERQPRADTKRTQRQGV